MIKHLLPKSLAGRTTLILLVGFAMIQLLGLLIRLQHLTIPDWIQRMAHG